jgi:hypothetical protein
MEVSMIYKHCTSYSRGQWDKEMQANHGNSLIGLLLEANNKKSVIKYESTLV